MLPASLYDEQLAERAGSGTAPSGSHTASFTLTVTGAGTCPRRSCCGSTRPGPTLRLEYAASVVDGDIAIQTS